MLKSLKHQSNIYRFSEVIFLNQDYVKDQKNWKEISYKKNYTLIEDIALIYNIGNSLILGMDKDHTSLSKRFFN
jgi:hypothetical protein